MTITLATHHGMCFGVRDALRATHSLAASRPVTVLGQLVHNPEVDRHLRSLGAGKGDLEDVSSASSRDVVITAHGAADKQRETWTKAGFAVIDTTCPLVRKAHDALAVLVADGYFPVVIGQASHVEVRGLIGDFPHAAVVLSETDIVRIPDTPRIGVISQTTQPLEVVLGLVEQIKRSRSSAVVRFIDTVCHPTKQRQSALDELCRTNELIIVIGGRNSNNTRQLVEKAGRLGRRAIQIERADDLRTEWFRDVESVGVTAGTSTLDETVEAVMIELRGMAAEKTRPSLPVRELLGCLTGWKPASLLKNAEQKGRAASFAGELAASDASRSGTHQDSQGKRLG